MAIKKESFDICGAIRGIVELVPEGETVLLPAIKPSLWRGATVDTEFEKIETAKLLQFIADMIE